MPAVISYAPEWMTSRRRVGTGQSAAGVREARRNANMAAGCACVRRVLFLSPTKCWFECIERDRAIVSLDKVDMIAPISLERC